jgi:hypothetical protein
MLTEADLDHRRPARRAFYWLVGARSHRVICILVGLWVINIFDLVLTTLAYRQGLLHELNPIARKLLPLGPVVLAVFKAFLVGGSSVVLVRYRSRLIAEITAAAALVVYAAVAVRWRICYELYSLSATGTLTKSELDQFDSWLSTIPIL